jgi:hypothetical protein
MIAHWHQNGEEAIHTGACHTSQWALDAKNGGDQQAEWLECANEVCATDGHKKEREWMRQLEHVEEGVQRDQIVGISVQGFPGKRI